MLARTPELDELRLSGQGKDEFKRVRFASAPIQALKRW
jgi:hypothetical protein